VITSIKLIKERQSILDSSLDVYILLLRIPPLAITPSDQPNQWRHLQFVSREAAICVNISYVLTMPALPVAIFCLEKLRINSATKPSLRRNFMYTWRLLFDLQFCIFSLFGFSTEISSYKPTLVLPISQHQAQWLMTSQIRSRIGYVIPEFNTEFFVDLYSNLTLLPHKKYN